MSNEARLHAIFKAAQAVATPKGQVTYSAVAERVPAVTVDNMRALIARNLLRTDGERGIYWLTGKPWRGFPG